MRDWKKDIIPAFLLVSCFTACSKGGGTVENEVGTPHIVIVSDTTAPGIVISNPVANQVLSSGHTLNINGRVTDDWGLYRGRIRVINDANGFEMKNQAYEIHGILSYDFSLTYIPTVTVPTDLTITVFFEDHGLNTTTRSVKVKVNP